LAYTAGNESPQLDVVLVAKDDGDLLPLHADWLPGP